MSLSRNLGGFEERRIWCKTPEICTLGHAHGLNLRKCACNICSLLLPSERLSFRNIRITGEYAIYFFVFSDEDGQQDAQIGPADAQRCQRAVTLASGCLRAVLWLSCCLRAVIGLSPGCPSGCPAIHRAVSGLSSGCSAVSGLSSGCPRAVLLAVLLPIGLSPGYPPAVPPAVLAALAILGCYRAVAANVGQCRAVADLLTLQDSVLPLGLSSGCPGSPPG